VVNPYYCIKSGEAQFCEYAEASGAEASGSERSGAEASGAVLKRAFGEPSGA